MDAVEYFLFEEQRGYCEQFSSSLAVMARSLGIPARIATGYTAGEYNPFTGLHEVKASDARLYSRYKEITTAFEEAGVIREEHETPEESDESGVAWLGEIYLYARFRNAVPTTLIEEFDRLEPSALTAAGKLKEASKVRS